MKFPRAIFSLNRKYRYVLTREWDSSKPCIAFVGLNPSTADENLDDPTIRRCIGYAKDWGYGGLIMINLFAFRATDPKNMKNELYPHGSENNYWLIEAAKEAEIVVFCWGTHGSHKDRENRVVHMYNRNFPGMQKFCYLGLTKDGHPKHPLYLKKDLKPVVWNSLT